MGTIVAIGGGEFIPCQLPETWQIDRRIVDLTRVQGKEKPRVLFIPTASEDDLWYCNSIFTTYHLRLGCEFDHLRILAEGLTDEQIQRKILSADIIYVGGGNTEMMMRVWRARGVDKLLKQAYQSETILCGLSAGAICWFDWGLSDSQSYTNPKDWKPTVVRGLGLIPGACCPHFDSEVWRPQVFREVLRRSSRMGIAIENNCAMQFSGPTFQVLTSQPGKQAYTQHWKDGLFESLPISQTADMQSLSLLNK